jgi:hypothetical protein
MSNTSYIVPYKISFVPTQGPDGTRHGNHHIAWRTFCDKCPHTMTPDDILHMDDWNISYEFTASPGVTIESLEEILEGIAQMIGNVTIELSGGVSEVC